jgi:hypothetical protein
VAEQSLPKTFLAQRCGDVSADADSEIGHGDK